MRSVNWWAAGRWDEGCEECSRGWERRRMSGRFLLPTNLHLTPSSFLNGKRYARQETIMCLFQWSFMSIMDRPGGISRTDSLWSEETSVRKKRKKRTPISFLKNQSLLLPLTSPTKHPQKPRVYPLRETHLRNGGNARCHGYSGCLRHQPLSHTSHPTHTISEETWGTVGTRDSQCQSCLFCPQSEAFYSMSWGIGRLLGWCSCKQALGSAVLSVAAF